ncbi:NAD(P)H-quinone oxidoreductase subunit N [Leptolyngbya sp. FACHB-261]|uniref:NAD(P)H-quinone oxidoreductase subunit N n=1 Tax=Leptolyngbya sp. FACHB-261 TaxID=2692806 RepID=UPI0016884B0C|nr:NAD(P)H-quinone oxidoreductase subunit N [Leptolyngbya sp. FACHB-261]MBD2105218.1 NAD(P)H-quinone oxidoreductase subunit N [Leptolyngbya sp. FACHB-261]
MSLIITGRKMIQDLESNGALALCVPPEGGFEGRYQRRLRGAGYGVLTLTARGLGDLSAYLTSVHGVRPAHLGKKEIRTYFYPPLLQYQLDNLPPNAKGLVLWLIEGKVLSRQELQFLVTLPTLQPKVKVVVEVASAREISWQPLRQAVAAA